MSDITAEEARTALEAADRARRQVADEVGLPRGYWWMLAAAWLGLGVIGDLGPSWLVSVATFSFGAAHAAVASRLLDGRRRTAQVQVSATVAGNRTPIVVIAMLLGLVGLTIGAAFGLHANGARDPDTWSAALVAAVIGFGGPEILRVLRHWTHA
jgi:hypothetical protein